MHLAPSTGNVHVAGTVIDIAHFTGALTSRLHPGKGVSSAVIRRGETGWSLRRGLNGGGACRAARRDGADE